ncbi:hypothetical protein M9978_08415 [Sphingomonas sp. MG17]|uniref:Uncharacterized protein n=1 Tax=Sphingomonas tagetis TaxID=2949092 RepID=A0A9X2KLJ0_9SPHN|nr:hypothetical protein [Sphingomonas tagetis]MCP3730451.1 hypothetical protein [Sphingomonas tagetis]
MTAKVGNERTTDAQMVAIGTGREGEDFKPLLAGDDYETVAASQANQVLGATGASGDLLAALTIVPATTSPGAVSIKDGDGAAITLFAGGADSVGSLIPFAVALGIKSTGGAWKVTTGANVSVIAAGEFS